MADDATRTPYDAARLTTSEQRRKLIDEAFNDSVNEPADAQAGREQRRITVSGSPVFAAPGAGLVDPRLLPDQTFGGELRTLVDVDKNTLGLLSIAAADLTDGRAIYAGHRDELESPAASMAKVGAMVAAFQLRRDLDTLAQQERITRSRELVASYGHALADAPATVTSAVARHPPVIGRVIDLDRFDRTGRVEFSERGPDPRRDPMARVRAGERLRALNELDDANDKKSRIAEVPRMGFAPRLEFAVRFSNNYGATTVIRDLGLPYIQAVLRQIGLYDETHGGGVWLGSEYARIAYEPAPGRRSSGTLAPVAVPEPRLIKRPTTSQGMTARMAIALLVLLDDGRLVSPADSGLMLALMKKDTDPSAQSFLANAASDLAEYDQTAWEDYSKIGIQGPLHVDMLLSERSFTTRESDAHTVRPRFAIAVLRSTFEELSLAGQRVTELIVKRRLGTAPAPTDR